MHRETEKQACHAHEWVVFSTALEEHWLMLQCIGCGWHGVVEAPSAREWSQAFRAPSRPYRWYDEARVKIKRTEPDGLFHVMHAGHGKKCECYAELGVVEPRGYERVPAEILRSPEALTPEERAHLHDLAEVVATTDLCSQLYPYFLRSFQQDTGHEVLGALYRFAMRIEKVHRQGFHCSASVVAHLLKEYARRAPGNLKEESP
jgi:hypothetical protein